MAAFIITAVILTVLVLLLLFWGARGGSARTGDGGRVKTNLEALQGEYAALEKNRSEGRLSQAEYEEVRTELERRVLEETKPDTGLEKADRRQRLGTFLFIALFVPVAAGVIYWRFGTWDAFNPEVAQAQSSTGGHSMAELDAQLAHLEQNLKDNPSDVNGWMLYARTNDALKRFDKASAAYEKLASLLQGSARAQVLADWADCLAAQTGNLSGRPEALVDEALKIEPSLWKALALKGTALYNRGEYRQAASVWERILRTQEPGSEDWGNTIAMVNDARAKAGMPQLTETAQVKRLEERPSGSAAAPAAAARLSGTVTISPDLKAKLSGDETVFVFARPIEGSKMPVAVTQLKASELPASFTIDSSMRLPGGMGGLESLSRVVVGARVSKTGNLMPQPGDLEGYTPAVSVGSSNLVVKITSEVSR